ncbi:hypothetical protein ACTHAM_001349 [Cellulomonas soli]|uniref:hypothetical protein n=1 Tax=Cellulomonas soli TaxID=931535 RepID=UPI003F880116
MTGHPAARPAGFVTLELPEDWVVVELADDAERVRSVEALVDRQLGRADEWATLRRTLRGQLLEQTARAAAHRGQLMGVSLMEVGGVPIPASVTVHTLPGQDLEALGRTVLAEASGAEGLAASVDLTEGELGVILRRVRAGTVRTDLAGLTGEDGGTGGGEDRALESFVVDYWIEPHGSTDLVYLAFSSPLVGARDALVSLFDAIVGTVQTVNVMHEPSALEN